MLNITYQKYNYYFTKNLFNVTNIIESYNATEAPSNGSLGVWKGSADVSDNLGDYYITHDYSFYGQRILKSKINDTFIIKGQKYKIYDIFKVKNTTVYNDIKNKVEGNGETASIQVCIPNTDMYQIIIAKAI